MKLFIIPARNADAAVILRRGPSAWYHIILWYTNTDTFEHGAWFKGRIYEEKCDVSPDGKLLLYSVHQGARVGTSYTDSWTAVSRVPWLQALVLWPQGTTYGGGGRFVGNRTVVLRGVGEPHPDHPLQGLVRADGSVDIHQSANAIPSTDWSGYDHHSRVIYTIGGKLFAKGARSTRSHTVEPDDTELADFTDLQPDPQPAPEWARARIND